MKELFQASALEGAPQGGKRDFKCNLFIFIPPGNPPSKYSVQGAQKPKWHPWLYVVQFYLLKIDTPFLRCTFLQKTSWFFFVIIIIITTPNAPLGNINILFVV